ncbi:putative tRNA pseudouridine synthase D [uncultured archaeon]|nr:putative tRNA pseudouridine synthase D [uncultured archaeon]
MGSLEGNRFTIAVEGVSDGAEETVRKILEDVNGRFPNYFGEQRFGMRGNSAEIGRCIARRDFEAAAMEYLTGTGQKRGDEEREGARGGGGGAEENEGARKARKRLAEEKDFAAAYNYFPQHLKYERMLLEHLARIPTDFAGALRRLPRGILLLFVHALQSRIFNLVLSERIGAGEVNARTPLDETANLIGYESVPTEPEARALEVLEVSPEDFRLKGMPELSSKGTKRQLLAELKEFSFACEAGNAGENGKENARGKFRFTLGAGSYATMALREFMDGQR